MVLMLLGMVIRLVFVVCIMMYFVNELGCVKLGWV